MNAPLDGTLFGPGQPCFGCAPDHPLGFRLTFVRDGDDVVTRFTPDTRHQGPPGIMHGGLVSTIADEVAAWALIALRGRFGFTVTFEARLQGPIRIGIPLEARSRITDDRRRLIDVAVVVRQQDEDRYTGQFRFAVLDRAAAEKMLGGPLPEHWAVYCR